jgi:subtilase family serine protease
MSNRSEALMRTFVSAVLIAAVLSSLSYAVTSDRISGALNSGQSVTLRGSIHHQAVPKYDAGPADPGLRFGSIMLMTTPTPSQQKALTRLVAEQQDPKSPNYHKWLTPEQWADRFGLSPNDVKQITSWLKGQGFSRIQVARGRNWFTFSGTATQVQSAFGTEIHRFNVNGELHVANTTSPKIPAALAGIVTGVSGLDDFHLQPKVVKAHPYYYDNTFAQPNFLAPADIATMYDITALTGIDGTGQRLAIIGQTDIFLADINDFRSAFNLPPISGCTSDATTGLLTACNTSNFQYVLVPSAPDPGAPLINNLAEADLDLEWSGAVAPNAQIIYVNAPANFGANPPTGGVRDAWFYAVDQNLAPVISLSYGNCEFFYFGVPGAIGSPDETELMKANSMGITFVSSAGDSGAFGCDPNSSDPNGSSAMSGIAVTYPASSPEVTGVGGTSISLTNLTGSGSSTYWGTTNGANGGSLLSYAPEQAYNDDDDLVPFCAANATNTFCTQGGGTPVTGWQSPITTEAIAQSDLALVSTGIQSSGGGASNCAVQNSSATPCASGFTQPTWQTVTVPSQASNRFVPDVSLLASASFPGYIFCTPQEAWLGGTSTASTCVNGISGTTGAVELYNSRVGGTSASTPIFAAIVTLLNQYLAGPAWPGLGNINPKLYALAAVTPSNGAFHQVTTGDNNVACTANSGTFPCPSTGTFGYLASNADPTTGYNLVTGLGSVDVDKLAVAWNGSRAPTTLLISPSATQITQGQSVTFTATVSPTTALGNVSFFNNGSTTALSTVGLTSSGNGVATFATTALPLGTNSLTAAYSGDISDVPSTTTTAATVMVNPAGPPFSLSLNTSSFSVTQGSAVDVPVNLTLNSGFTGTVTFACTDPASESTCTAPAAQTKSGSYSFHITTTAATASLIRPFDRSSKVFYAVLLPGLLGILLTVGSRKRSLRGMRMLGLIMVLGVSTMWLGSCGGSNNKSTGNPGTPKGQYTISVTGTSGSSTATASFKITVQ